MLQGKWGGRGNTPPLEGDHRGHCHGAKTREHGDYLPLGMRDKHQDTEEWRDAKVSCVDLEQWEVERSAYRL